MSRIVILGAAESGAGHGRDSQKKWVTEAVNEPVRQHSRRRERWTNYYWVNADIIAGNVQASFRALAPAACKEIRAANAMPEIAQWKRA